MNRRSNTLPPYTIPHTHTDPCGQSTQADPAAHYLDITQAGKEKVGRKGGKLAHNSKKICQNIPCAIILPCVKQAQTSLLIPTYLPYRDRGQVNQLWKRRVNSVMHLMLNVFYATASPQIPKLRRQIYRRWGVLPLSLSFWRDTEVFSKSFSNMISAGGILPMPM